jgi:hypothetical protein
MKRNEQQPEIQFTFWPLKAAGKGWGGVAATLLLGMFALSLVRIPAIWRLN